MSSGAGRDSSWRIRQQSRKVITKEATEVTEDKPRRSRASTNKRTLIVPAVLFSVVSVRSVVSSRVLTQKDVKNEDRSDYVYENKGEDDIMSGEKHGFLQENATIAR